MANYAVLKEAIDNAIKANGQREITGDVMNQVLTAMVNSLGDNYQFAGVATPTTNPGQPDQNVFYMAIQAGTYTNFSAIVLQAGISILLWDGSWSSETFFTIDSVPTSESTNLITSGAVFEKFKLDGGAYDVSAHNSGVTFASLSALLNSENLNTLIPVAVRHGGMSIKYIQSSDNKYIQYRYISSSTAVADFTNVSNWQGVDDEPVAGSENLVKSGGVNSEFAKITEITLNDFVFNGYYKASDGTYTNSESRRLTDYYRVVEGDKISYNIACGAAQLEIVAFDNSKNVILSASKPGITAEDEGIYVVPSGTSYLRFCEGGFTSHIGHVIFEKSVVNLTEKVRELESVNSFLSNFTNNKNTTRLLVPITKRKNGVIITYDNGIETITEKYFGTSVANEQWVLDENWRRITEEDSFLVAKSDLQNAGIGNLIDKWERGYIKNDGTEVNISTTYRKTGFIAVEQGKTYKFRAKTSNTPLAISGYASNTQQSIILNSVPFIVNTIDEQIVDIPFGVSYVRLSTESGTLNIAGLWEYPNSIEENSLKLTSENYYKTAGFSWFGGIIKPDGTVADAPTSDYKHTLPLKVVPSSTIYVNVCSHNSNSKAFAFYGSDGATYIDVTESDYYTKGTTGIIAIPVPSNAYYVRLQCEITTLPITQAGQYQKSFLNDNFPNKPTLDKFSEQNGHLLWNGSLIESELSAVVADLPVSDGTGIESGYAYIDSINRTIKVKA